MFDGALTFVNEAFCRFFGVARNDAIGACLFEPDDPQAPIMPREAAEVLNVAFEKLTPEIPRATEEIEIVGSDGETRWLLCTHQALFDHRDFLIEYQTVALEITDRKLADSKIQYLAHHDALTGLPNRALFHDRMELAMAHAERNQGRAAILLLDLDNFKHVNDALGHATGDILLRDVAGRLKECVRAVDTVARLGGDEFVIIQAGIETGEQAVILAERIRAAITKPFAIEGHDIHTGTSIGITIYPDDSVDSAQVLKNADMALYRAKARERGTYEFYSRELGRTAQKRLDIAAGLRRALAVGEELSLVFQPKFSLESVRRLYAGLQRFRSMSRMDASLMKASALRLRFSQSLASRRQRLSQAMVRSTTQRLGWTTKPFTRSDRLTISVSRSGRMPARAR